MGNHQVGECHQRHRPTQQSAAHQGNQCHQKQVQQGPACHPRLPRLIGTRRTQQPITGRQLQVDREIVQWHLPAGQRHAAQRAARQLQAGIKLQMALAQFHSATVAGALADQQGVACDTGALEHPGRLHRKAARMIERSRYVVAGRETVAIERQPQFPLDADFLAHTILAGPCARLDLEALVIADSECRQVAPISGHARLRCVHRVALHPCLAQVRIVGIAPDLMLRPWLGSQLDIERTQRLRAPRGQRDLPVPGTHLQVHVTVAVQTRRNGRIQSRGHEILRQDRPQRDFPCTPADIQLQAGAQRRWQAIVQATEYLQRQTVGLTRGGRTLAQGQ